MERTQIYLTREEKESLITISEALGRPQSEIIREAVDRYITEFKHDRRQAILRQTAGMWADRDDLDEFLAGLRREGDERPLTGLADDDESGEVPAGH